MRKHFATLKVAIPVIAATLAVPVASVCAQAPKPHPATKDNATDFVGVEDDPLQ